MYKEGGYRGGCRCKYLKNRKCTNKNVGFPLFKIHNCAYVVSNTKTCSYLSEPEPLIQPKGE